MITNIIIENNKQKDSFPLADKIHDLLKGNQDYVDSNIVLNFDKGKNPEEVTVFFSKDDCKDVKYIVEKIKQIADLIGAEEGEVQNG